MKKTARLFPGQGSQYVGMGREFVETDLDAADLMDMASMYLGIDVRKLCLEGPMEELTQVRNLHVALTSVNLICLKQLEKRLGYRKYAYVAGHSLGEFSALRAAGVLNTEETINIVNMRGKLLACEGEKHPGCMAAVLGLDLATVEKILAEGKPAGTVVIANHNTETQIVLSGDAEGLAAAETLCKAAGAKVIPLKVSVANHSPLIADAVKPFFGHLAGFDFRDTSVPMYFNVTAALEHDRFIIRNELMPRQLVSRVRWYEIIQAMLADGVELFVELGPGKVLTGLMKKILPKGSPIQCMQADTPETLDAVASAIQS